jgi:predicted SprT family Zn-dependent metalloprotease
MKKKLMTLNLFGQRWKVYHAKIDPQYAGHCYYETNTIEINDEIPQSTTLFQETLIHELLHALYFRMSYRQSGLSHDLEEVMIDQLAKALTENFRLQKR